MTNRIEAELKILRCLNLKANYSELARIHSISRQTISKYDKGFSKKETREKKSKLDPYKDEIKEKINLPGVTITGVYKYFYNKDKAIGSRSNFDYYVRKHKLIDKKKSLVHPRYETKPGDQMQFDFKESLSMFSRYGEIFEFNILSSTLGHSRMHKFTYSKTKTQEDVIRCLIETFIYYGGVPKRLLTDNMSSIININTKKFNENFIQFSKDFNFKPEKCKVRTPQTKGKVESANRFINRLIPYNGEFETEEELIEIINKLSNDVNNEENQTTGVRPLMLLKNEKEYLSPIPSKDIIESYLNYLKPTTVYKDSMIYYKGKRYSVPHKFINKTLKVRELDNKLYIYNNIDLIRIHPIVQKPLNYHEDDYKNIMNEKLHFKESRDIESFAMENLEILDNLKG